jgi:hypothetical protein
LQLFSIVMVLIYYLSIMWQVWHFFKDSSHMKFKMCLFFFVIETSNQVGDEYSLVHLSNFGHQR